MTAAAPKNKPQKKEFRNLIWYILLGLMIATFIVQSFQAPKEKNVGYSEFKREIANNSFSKITILSTDKKLKGVTKDGKHITTNYLEYPTFLPELEAKGINLFVDPSDSSWAWSLFAQAILPFLLIFGLWFFIFRQAQGMGGQALQFGKSRAKQFERKPGDKVTTFNDVAGANEAIEELSEIVDFLKHPKKYTDIGAKIPKGVLLMGPPGTGKTLLARAIAGEADVPFFSLSGSDFVEMFVGVGASRVRDLFEQAKKSQPCLIFLDEIDAVGRHRGAGMGGGHDEREQTLNQLLVQMDGFDANQTIIVIAATNRPDILDPALLRPGRFDRQITVDRPDITGRADILKIHAKHKKLAPSVVLDIIAKRTPGFTGADLANLMNEAALLAARHSRKQITMEDLEESTDRVMAGPQRKSRVMTEKEKNIITYHELGHAIVAAALPETDPVHKVSILPRGMALGYTLQLPEKDKYLSSKTEIENNIKVFMGGRVAEQLFIGDITSGASNDIERATALARHYVCTYGMSAKLGPRKYGHQEQQVFLGKNYPNQAQDYSDATAQAIDEEIQLLLNSSYREATDIINKHKDLIEKMAVVLKEKEVIDGPEFMALFEGKDPEAQ